MYKRQDYNLYYTLTIYDPDLLPRCESMWALTFALRLLFSGPDIDSSWVFVDDLVAGVTVGVFPNSFP